MEEQLSEAHLLLDQFIANLCFEDTAKFRCLVCMSKINYFIFLVKYLYHKSKKERTDFTHNKHSRVLICNDNLFQYKNLELRQKTDSYWKKNCENFVKVTDSFHWESKIIKVIRKIFSQRKSSESSYKLCNILEIKMFYNIKRAMQYEPCSMYKYC